MNGIAALLVVSSLALCASSVSAQTATPQAPAAAPAPVADSGRFRFGIDGTVGLESVSADGASASGLMFGIDLRLGYQINHMFAVYAQPHLSFGSLSAGGTISGGTGTFIGTIMGEVTLSDVFFGALGVGYGILNNPSGPAIEARLGAYPLMSHDDDGPGRTGLMVGVDFRTVFIDGATGILFMGCVGYESF